MPRTARAASTPASGPVAERGDGTRVVHAGLPAAADGTPFLPGPTFAAPFHLAGPADASEYGYGRDANPTWTLFEAAIGELEGERSLPSPRGWPPSAPSC